MSKSKKRITTRKAERVEPSRGNVFADMGLTNADERMLKAQLAVKIIELIEQKGWTQARTAEVIGLDPAESIASVAREAVRHLSGAAHQYP